MSKQYPGGFIMANPTAPTKSAAPGIWTLDQAQQYIKAGTWPGPFDPQFNYVTMLLPGNGTNGAQNNTFLDSSTNNFSITRNGNTTQGTFAPYGANWSNYFDGTGDYLTVPSNAAFTFGTGDFTVEMWVYTGSTANMALLDARPTGTAEPWALYTNASSFPYFYDGSSYTSSIALTLNSWNHVAVSRSSGTLRIFVNGTQGLSGAVSTNLTSGALNIGGAFGGAYFTGYISNIRILKGTALYTANFTPPTAPLTAITNTSLLTCQSNRFIDNSANNFTITRNGDVSVQVFSPFSPTASYAAGTNGGSGYFDGTGDYLDVANDNTFDTNSTYTLECWFYQPAAGNAMLFNRGGGTGNWSTSNGYQFTLLISSGILYWQWNNAGSPATISGTTPTAGAWHHVAIGYNGTTTRVWVDGASIGTSTTAYTLPSTRSIIRVGADQSTPSSNPLTGYISGLRFVKGTDVYGVGNTTITVPTAPLTAITNTSLLLNFTNAGVIDNAMMNNLETVGNAQISTTQSKWGGSSIAFDGTGDALSTPANVNLAFGTGNFTIEMWVYGSTANNSSTIGGSWPRFFVLGTSQTAGCIESYVLSGGTIYVELFGAGSLTFTASTLLNSTWNHFAATRSGTTLRLFVNGTQQDSGTFSTNLNLPATSSSWIGAVSASAGNFNGYIDDLRITKGFARYTANFTAPTAPFFTS